MAELDGTTSNPWCASNVAEERDESVSRSLNILKTAGDRVVEADHELIVAFFTFVQ